MLIDHVYQRFHQKVAAISQLPLLGRKMPIGWLSGRFTMLPTLHCRRSMGKYTVYFTTIIIVRVTIMIIINLILLIIVLIVIVYILLYDWLGLL